MRNVLAVAGRALRVRNSLNQTELETVSIRDGPRLLWYSCGPTVYDDAHLGHARAYVSFDIIRRVIGTLLQTPVKYALGITDVDDKILKRAHDDNVCPRELATRYERRFFEDMDALNVQRPTTVLRVTEHVPEIIAFIDRLVKSGSAYVAPSGDVYFSVASRGKRYGQLDPSRGLSSPSDLQDPGPSKSRSREENVVETTDAIDSPKKDARDFALWKVRSAASETSTLEWDSPWGRGRPGWHIECSAMATAALGPRMDIHSGGIDLRFPHHTNELATAEAYHCCEPASPCAGIHSDTTDDRWSTTWLHAGHLHMAGRKMSKSVKNFVTVREYLSSGGDPDAFRMFCLLHHYAAPVEYSADRIVEAGALLDRIRRFVSTTAAVLNETPVGSQGSSAACEDAAKLLASSDAFRNAYRERLLDDFDTRNVVSEGSNLVATGNLVLTKARAGVVSGSSLLALADVTHALCTAFDALGINLGNAQTAKHTHQTRSDDAFDKLLATTLQFRSDVRRCAKDKNTGGVFQACDQVRDDLRRDHQISVTDTAKGQSWEVEARG